MLILYVFNKISESTVVNTVIFYIQTFELQTLKGAIVHLNV